MTTDLVPLAFLMGLATYPWRALPLLAPGIERLPSPIQDYLRLVGPAMLGALAAVGVGIVIDATGQPGLHLGVEWLAVAACILIVVARRGLLTGLLVAAALVAILRATGLAPLP
jgi:branched-subunit amino acid transport protein